MCGPRWRGGCGKGGRRSSRLGAPTRCQFVYPDADTQVMLVGLRRNGELTTEVPYPARREPR